MGSCVATFLDWYFHNTILKGITHPEVCKDCAVRA